MRSLRARLLAIVIAISLFACRAEKSMLGPSAPLRIGSKRFTESYILAEIAAGATLGASETKPQVAMGLGGTAIVFEALASGSIDVYPEYTGTIAEVVFHLPPGTSRDDLATRLAERGLAMTAPLGFSNTYALAVAAAAPSTAGLRRISDLHGHDPARPLRLGLSPEFIGRSDGFPGLARAYGLQDLTPRSVDHGLAYDAIGRGDLDVIDVYSTDAKIPRLGLRLLEDDRHFFPAYDAVFLYRVDARRRLPGAFAALEALAGLLDAGTMTSLNARVEIDGASFAEAAQGFLRQKGAPPVAAVRPWVEQLAHVVADEGPRHLGLVMVSVSLAIALGIPLGILAYRRPRLGSAILGVTGILQTVPSLALLCFMIPLFGIGEVPALVALFLYALLPIVRSTAVGFADIPTSIREVAVAIGLPPRARLFRIELPLASRAIFAGIKTSAVINVGTATLAAFIGAGGFGVPISTGLSLNDNSVILLGAVPAALLAVLLEAAFHAIERFIVPEGLRLDARRTPT